MYDNSVFEVSGTLVARCRLLRTFQDGIITEELSEVEERILQFPYMLCDITSNSKSSKQKLYTLNTQLIKVIMTARTTSVRNKHCDDFK